MHLIEVVDRKSGEVVKRMEAGNQRMDDRLSRGLYMQLNTNKYFIRVTAAC